MPILLLRLVPPTSIPVCHLSYKTPSISNLLLAVLGIGERVGITPLGGLVACLYAANPEYVKSKYNLSMLREIENLVAEAVEVNIPFMNPITYVSFGYLSPPSDYHFLSLLFCGLLSDKVVIALSRTRLVSMPRPSSTTLVPTKSSSPRTLVSHDMFLSVIV